MTGRPAWSGRRSRRLVAWCLTVKGSTCWLCGQPGADSADHNPPRRDLVAAGVPDPDALRYLFPAHLVCNQRRGTRPVTPDLLAELAARRGVTSPAAARSPRFLSGPTDRGRTSFPPSPGPSQNGPDVDRLTRWGSR